MLFERMPGVLFVATGEDVRADGLGDVPCMVPLVNRDGTPRHDTPRPVLALGRVRHVGQPVALVVAETLTDARDAAEAIEVEYDPLPAVTEARDAISPGAPQLFDHIPSNIVFDWDNDIMMNLRLHLRQLVQLERMAAYLGVTIGFIVNYTPEHAVRFDLQGNPVEFARIAQGRLRSP